ncbi:MAG: AMP-binding protein, partial [Firmicutes bacterium]|nr:AMP-binding protein [Bacillota bacterium]
MVSIKNVTVDGNQQTIAQLITAAAERFGDSTFLEDDNLTLDFRSFAQQCRRVAAAVIASGLQPGDRVGIWAPNISEWVIAALGAQYAGMVLVTVNTRYKGSEAAYILRTSRVELLFCIGEFLGVDYPALLQGETLPHLREIIVFQPSRGPYCRWQDFVQRGTAITDRAIDKHAARMSGDDIADILFTSGTTGNPKGVMTTHAQNLSVFTIFADIVGFRAGDRYLVINP